MGYSYYIKDGGLMLKKLISVLFLFYSFASLEASDRYISIPSDSDSDSEQIVLASDMNLKTMSDVELLRSLAPDQLLEQAKMLLNSVSLRNIDPVVISKDQDGNYMIDQKLFQNAKFFLQSEYDSLSRSLQSLASGSIFDVLFRSKFESKQAAEIYITWLKQSYKYAFVEALKQKFERSKPQVLKRFEKFKDEQASEVNKMMLSLQKQYPSAQSYSQNVIVPATVIAACSYGKRMVTQSSLKKYYNYIAVPIALSAVGYNLLGLYAKHLKAKNLDVKVSDLQSILKSIDHESLQLNTQSYDQMIALFMRGFDARCEQFLQQEIKRLDSIKRPAQEPQGALVVRQPVAQGALVVRDGGHSVSALQKFAGFFKKIVHS